MHLSVHQNGSTTDDPIFSITKPISIHGCHGFNNSVITDISMMIKGIDKLTIALTIDNKVAKELGLALIALADKVMEGEVNQESYEIGKDKNEHRINRMTFSLTEYGWKDNHEKVIAEIRKEIDEETNNAD